MAPQNFLKDKFRNGELDLSSCGLKDIPKDIVRTISISILHKCIVSAKFSRIVST